MSQEKKKSGKKNQKFFTKKIIKMKNLEKNLLSTQKF